MAREMRSRLRALRHREPAELEPDGAELVSWMPAEPATDAAADPGGTPEEEATGPEAAEARLRRSAVLAYTSALLEAPADAEAAEDVLSAFAEQAAEATETAKADDLLLAVTRVMTAVSLPDRSTPRERRQAVRASLGDRPHCTCREAPPLLAARANGTIEERESPALDAHLETCAICQELQGRLVAAEARFRGVIGGREEPRPAASS